MIADPTKSSRRLRKTDLALVVTAVVSVMLFWGTYLYVELLRSSYYELRRQHPKPYLINGYRIDPIRYSLPDPAWDGRLARELSTKTVAVGRTLLLASADTCNLCRIEQDQWVQLAKEIDLAAADQVLLVSHEGATILTPVADVLRSRQISFQVRTIEDPNIWAAATGIVSAPTTVVLDRENRVRLLTKRLTPQTRRIVVEFFRPTTVARR